MKFKKILSAVISAAFILSSVPLAFSASAGDTRDFTAAEQSALISADVPQNDISGLTAAYNAYKSYVPDAEKYTPVSIAAFKEHIPATSAAADTVINNKDATEQEINNCIAIINREYERLVEKADKTALSKAYAEAVALNESDYTPATYALLKKAFTAAKAVIDDENATKADAANAADAIARAEAALSADKTDINNLYNELLKLDLYDYTATSKQNFKKALYEAKAVIDNDNAVPQEVRAAITALNNAKEALEEKVILDYNEWEAFAQKVEIMRASGKYNADDIAALQKYVYYIEDKRIETQAELDEYSAYLITLINSARTITHDSTAKTSSSSDTGETSALFSMSGLLAAALVTSLISLKKRKEIK